MVSENSFDSTSVFDESISILSFLSKNLISYLLAGLPLKAISVFIYADFDRSSIMILSGTSDSLPPNINF